MSQFLPDLLLTLLYGMEAMFTHPGIIEAPKEKLAEEEFKDIIKQTASNKAAREVLGHNAKVWRAMAETLHSSNATPSDASAARLAQVLPRARDLLILGRNMVAKLPKSQDLAAYEGFEAELRVLMTVAVNKASAPISRDETSEQAQQEARNIKEMYKKILTTCLQFLHNFIVGNEVRRVHLFAQLIGPFPDNGDITYSYTNTPSLTDDQAEKTKPHVQSESRVTQPFYSPGLLPKIPRILGPSEIEGLPMILQSLVVPTLDSDVRMQNLRCNMLVALPGGQNILREMLVFLAQWDLEEHDLAYKLMVQVIGAVLANGKIKELYEKFKSDKDIISPAQCVILKLLVTIWRPKHPDLDSQFKNVTLSESSSSSNDPWSHMPVIEDNVAEFFCAEFLNNVLPYIRTLIHAQNDVIDGRVKRESFEWSVWDMDRAYEGLYQLMDVIVILTEELNITQVLLKHEPTFVKALIEFLRDMEAIFPRYIKAKEQPVQHKPVVEAPPPPPPPAEVQPYKVGVGAVERPYDVEDDQYLDGEEEDEEDDTVSAEPEDFTWPHIKRFIVILLSNLAWKNKEVKDLIREQGGLQLILNHCKIDDDNPFIREHAILCIRNLLEENPANQDVVRKLEAKQVVPSEVLEQQGMQPYIADDGKVGIRKTT